MDIVHCPDIIQLPCHQSTTFSLMTTEKKIHVQKHLILFHLSRSESCWVVVLTFLYFNKVPDIPDFRFQRVWNFYEAWNRKKQWRQQQRMDLQTTCHVQYALILGQFHFPRWLSESADRWLSSWTYSRCSFNNKQFPKTRQNVIPIEICHHLYL